MLHRGIFAAVLLIGVALVPAAAADHGPQTILTVDDGEFFYDSKPDDGVCEGDTNDHTQGQALRHWHVGIPFAPAAAEFAGGFGCLGGPQTFEFTVSDGHEALVDGEVRYLWDQNVPGGCCNDVQIHIYDENGLLVYSTFEEDGPKPVDPLDPQIRSHEVNTTLGSGTYTIQEDVFSGEHTAWLTQLTVTERDAPVTTYG